MPGGTKEEQGIPLENLDNIFSLDEWDVIVQPILERYIDALELRRLNKTTSEKREKYKSRFQQLIPQVFKTGEMGEVKSIDVRSVEFRRQINELLNEINTNPKVLRAWIGEALEGKDAAAIARAKIGKGDAYKKLQKEQARERLLARFSKEEETLDKYVNKLMDKISRLGEQLLSLNYNHPEGLYGAHEVKADFEETPYMQKKLKELTEKVARQLEQGKGMVTMVGDMGTGKNYIAEHFAAKTHRPFFYFPCSRGMDAADLGFHFEFKKGESLVVPSQLARGLQTKNACILIDEPNALPPEVVAALHGLGDHNRAFVYNGIEFKAAEGVTIVMAMNPATYEHVKDMPEAISDRTLGQDMIIGYPPLTKLDQLTQDNLWSKKEAEDALQADNSLDKAFICDEALILRRYAPTLKTWNKEDFEKLWNVIINGEGEGILGDKANEVESLRPIILAMLNILKVCHKWRNKYKDKFMNRTISIRGSIAVMENYMQTGDVKKAFLDLYKPNSQKYDGGEEDYETLEQVMNDMAELEMAINEAV